MVNDSVYFTFINDVKILNYFFSINESIPSRTLALIWELIFHFSNTMKLLEDLKRWQESER